MPLTIHGTVTPNQKNWFELYDVNLCSHEFHSKQNREMSTLLRIKRHAYKVWRLDRDPMAEGNVPLSPILLTSLHEAFNSTPIQMSSIQPVARPLWQELMKSSRNDSNSNRSYKTITELAAADKLVEKDTNDKHPFYITSCKNSWPTLTTSNNL